MSKFISNGIRLLIAAMFLVTGFFITLFILIMTAMLSIAVVLRLRWRQAAQPPESVDRHSTKTIVDAEYTVVEK